MSLKQTLQQDLTAAMRAREQTVTATIRMVLTAITNEEVAGTEHRELTEADVQRVLTREAKKRREAATAYRDAKRPELADREEAELAVIEGYLPAQLSEEELAALVAQAVAQVGATGMPQLGQVMKVAQPLVAGRAEGGRVAAAVRAALTGG